MDPRCGRAADPRTQGEPMIAGLGYFYRVTDHHPVSWGIPCKVCGWREWKRRGPDGCDPVLVALVKRYDFDPRCEGWWCFRCLERLGRDVPPSAVIMPGDLFNEPLSAAEVEEWERLKAEPGNEWVSLIDDGRDPWFRTRQLRARQTRP